MYFVTKGQADHQRTPALQRIKRVSLWFLSLAMSGFVAAVILGGLLGVNVATLIMQVLP